MSKLKISFGYTILALIVYSFSMISCDKKFEYIPLEASAISNTLYMHIEDRNGDNLIPNHLSIEDLTIYSEGANREVEKRIVEIEGKPVLSISVPLPNAKKHQTTGLNQEKFYVSFLSNGWKTLQKACMEICQYLFIP